MKGRYNHSVISIAFKYFDNQYHHYLNEVFIKASQSSLSSRADPGFILGCCKIVQKKLNIEMMWYAEKL